MPLKRRKAQRQPRATDSGVSAEDYVPGLSLFESDRDYKPSSSRAPEPASQHVPNTDAPLTLLTNNVGIPPNLWELKQLENAVCRHDFKSLTESKDHGICWDKQPVLNAWMSKQVATLTQVGKDFLEAGTELYNTQKLSADMQPRISATLRQTLISLHCPRNEIERDPQATWSTNLKPAVEKFREAYTDYTKHLRPEAELGSNGYQWTKDHQENTTKLCNVIRDIIKNLPPSLVVTKLSARSVQLPPGSSDDPHLLPQPEISEGSVEDPFGADAARSLDSDTYVPSPIEGTWTTVDGRLSPPSPL